MDSISLVVSEETGRLSIAIGGELFYNLSLEELRLKLLEELRPKKQLLEYDEEEETDEEVVQDNE